VQQEEEGGMDVFDIISILLRSYLYIREVWIDFCLFIFSFVMTLEVLGVLVIS